MNDKNSQLDKIENEILKLSSEYFKISNSQNFVPYISPVPVSGKVLDENDLNNLIKASMDLWLTAGDFTETFEKKLSKYLGIRHALFVNSGSSLIY